MTNRFNSLAMGAILALTAGAAQAQSVTPARQLAFNGVAVPGCVMQTPLAPTSDNASVTSSTPGAADIVITRLVGDDGVPVGATVILTLPATCNQAHTLTLGSQNGGLANVDGTPVGGPFRALLPYVVALGWGSSSETYGSGDPDMTISSGDAATGSVTVTIEIPAGGAPLVAGAYSDQLVLELAAAG